MNEQVVTPVSRPTSVSWSERLKLDTLSQKLNISHYSLFDFIISIAIGVVIGIIWKRYAHFLIAAVVFVLILFVLTQFNVLDVIINWQRIYNFIGLHPIDPTASVATIGWNWAKENVLLIACAIIGFILGIKIS